MRPISRLTLRTPDGPFTVLGDAEAVLASGWTADPDSLRELIHADLRGEMSEGSTPALDQAEAAVSSYYDGDLAAPAAVPVHQQSGPFRVRAWEALRQVHAGEAITYAEYAARSGSPRAVRAAAGACASNAAALFVPCHRIIRTDGSIGGFRYGAEVKRSLLDREASLISS